MLRALLLIAAAVLPGAAAGHPGELCRSAALEAAARHGIPPALMLAITEVETGTTRAGRSGPWPWTLNIAGDGRWFDSAAEALGAARAAIAAGKRSTDIGCFQLNWRWHGQNFSDPREMLEPTTAADYAARFLSALAAEAGDWMTAAGWYHSRTPVHARRYRAAIARALGGGRSLRPAPDARPEPAPGRPASAEAPATARAPGTPAPGGVALLLLPRAGGALFGTGG